MCSICCVLFVSGCPSVYVFLLLNLMLFSRCLHLNFIKYCKVYYFGSFGIVSWLVWWFGSRIVGYLLGHWWVGGGRYGGLLAAWWLGRLVAWWLGGLVAWQLGSLAALWLDVDWWIGGCCCGLF